MSHEPVVGDLAVVQGVYAVRAINGDHVALNFDELNRVELNGCRTIWFCI
jgi:hypothetical protein